MEKDSSKFTNAFKRFEEWCSDISKTDKEKTDEHLGIEADAKKDATINIEKLNIYIQNTHILKDISLQLHDKKITCIIGPSGCGKTTLLKSINRMIDTTEHVRVEGRVFVDGEDIYLNFDKSKGKALEEGFTIYDTEQIVSLILADNYKCYDYESVYIVASILKEKFKMLDVINSYELEGDLNKFEKLSQDDETLLLKKCDECLILEDEMFISMDREDKNDLSKRINKKLSGEIFFVLMKIYEARTEKIKA